MAAFLKPDNLNVVWASGGDRLFPGTTKYASGWGVEIPPRQYFNEIDYKQDQMLAHINQRGIVEWDADTEYQVDKSYIQGGSGTIYRCVLTHQGQDPDLDVANTYWEIAFANAGDFYTKSEVDTGFISPTELSAYSYSKTETYSQAEVNTKTTVSSEIQAQAQSSNTVLITPLRLAGALKGTNQQLSESGFQKLPGGLIFQWGSTTILASSSVNLVFPIEFPTACFSVVGQETTTPASSRPVTYPSGSIPTTGITVTNLSAAGSVTWRWFAVGY